MEPSIFVPIIDKTILGRSVYLYIVYDANTVVIIYLMPFLKDPLTFITLNYISHIIISPLNIFPYTSSTFFLISFSSSSVNLYLSTSTSSFTSDLIVLFTLAHA